MIGLRSARAALVGMAAAATSLLGACNQQTVETATPALREHPQLREGANFAKAPVSLASVEGGVGEAPGFGDALKAALIKRGVALVDAKKARYFVNAYVSVRSSAQGNEGEYAVVIYGRDRRLLTRLGDAVTLVGDDGGSPASRLGAAAADDVSAYLSNTPEAAPPGDAAKPVAFAPTP